MHNNGNNAGSWLSKAEWKALTFCCGKEKAERTLSQQAD